jgi:hypothetical protein
MAIFEDHGKQRLRRRLNVDPKAAFRRRAQSATLIEQSEIARLRTLSPEESIREFLRIMRFGRSLGADAKA